MNTEVQSPQTIYSLPTIDVVYPLGTGSRWNNNELRYSIRSAVKNVRNLGRIFIVGHKPDWLTGVEHIPMPDSYRGNKDANLIAKVLAACDAGISRKFIRLSDDEYFLKPTFYHEMQATHWGDLAEKPDKFFAGKWKTHLRNTRDRMASLKLSTFHFDTHSPNAYDRNTFRAVMKEHPWATSPMTINTLYYNASRANGVPAGRETVSFHRAVNEIGKIRERTATARYMNHNDAGLTLAMKTILGESFPEPSQYENDRRPQSITTGDGRGIVTLAGGPIYATNAYINCRMLRRMGCTLPIEWCYLGVEMSLAWIDLIERTIPNCRLVDLGGNQIDNTKKKGGWQAKVDAVIQSRFAEILFLDADSFPLRDPSDLFEHPLFQNHDCILWPDIHTYDKNLQAFIADTYGVKVTGRQIESGQMLFRKKECLPGLLKTQAINRDSKEAYKHLFGDKDTFLIGAKQGGVDVAVNPHVVRRASCRNLKQFDLDGKPMFCHLTHGKWKPNKPAEILPRDYPQYADAVKIFSELETSIVAFQMPRIVGKNMRVRDTIGAVEAANIIQNDSYEIRPMQNSGRVKYIVDVGGNAGAFTYMASLCYPESKIIVIEPDPELMSDIRYNTRECKAQIHYVEKAVIGDDRQNVPYVRVAANRGGSYVRAGDWEGQREEPERPDDETFSVSATTLPQLLDEFIFPSVDLLKIDAEGVEGAVLLSLQKAGWMPRVHWIRGEWHGKNDWPRIRTALQDTHDLTLCEGSAIGYMIAHNRQDA